MVRRRKQILRGKEISARSADATVMWRYSRSFLGASVPISHRARSTTPHLPRILGIVFSSVCILYTSAHIFEQPNSHLQKSHVSSSG